jgi:WD40 repeat protein
MSGASQRSITSFFNHYNNNNNNNTNNSHNDSHNVSPSKSYLALREATIRRNREFLQSLGIADSIVAAPPPLLAPKKPRDKRTSPSVPTRRMPTRRAKRSLDSAAISENNSTNRTDAECSDDARHDASATVDADEEVTVEPVCFRDFPTLPVIPAAAFDASAQLQGFGANAAGAFRAQARVYGVDFGLVDNRLVVAMAGYQGLCSVAFVAPKDSTADPADSDDSDDARDGRIFQQWRPSTGWIGSVQFVSTDGKLLTASNDGKVRLFDVTTVTGAHHQPRLLTTATDFHKRGIFQAHCSRGVLLTASKDKSVAVGALQGTGITLVRRYASLLDCSMTTVRARTDDANVFAAGGVDAHRMAVCDVRAGGDAPSLIIAHGHASRMNSVAWHRDWLLSASCSSTLLLHDVRRADRALFEFTIKRGKAIVRPTFCNGGRNVVCGSDDWFELATFCTQSGRLVNQAKLIGCNTVQCGALDDALAEAVNGVAALHAPTIGGEALLLAAAGGDQVHILSGDVVATASDATAVTTPPANADESARADSSQRAE